MRPLSFLFWGLVLVTTGVSYRWGGMVGLVFFIVLLMIGAVAATHFGIH